MCLQIIQAETLGGSLSSVFSGFFKSPLGFLYFYHEINLMASARLGVQLPPFQALLRKTNSSFGLTSPAFISSVKFIEILWDPSNNSFRVSTIHNSPLISPCKHSPVAHRILNFALCVFYLEFIAILLLSLCQMTFPRRLTFALFLICCLQHANASTASIKTSTPSAQASSYMTAQAISTMTAQTSYIMTTQEANGSTSAVSKTYAMTAVSTTKITVGTKSTAATGVPTSTKASNSSSAYARITNTPVTTSSSMSTMQNGKKNQGRQNGNLTGWESLEFGVLGARFSRRFFF